MVCVDMSKPELAVEPIECPFCGATVASPGAGFVTHIEAEPACRESFETWRDRVSEDMRGGWPG